jgi:hypothetical protein
MVSASLPQMGNAVPADQCQAAPRGKDLSARKDWGI